MTCKDCLCNEVCKFKDETNPKECNETIADLNNIEKICNYFKDKIKYIELPCNIGDTVYILDYEDDNAVDYSGYIFIMANIEVAIILLSLLYGLCCAYMYNNMQ